MQSLECQSVSPTSNSVISVDLLRAADRSDSFPDDWSVERTYRALTDYERFLRLAAKHPDEPLAPTRDIDEMWHLHMLHPVAYAGDCKRLLGYVLDHDGGFGKGDGELPVLQKVFERTRRLWEAEFGVTYGPATGDAMTKCWHDCQSRCWHACKSKRPTLAL